MLNKFVLLEKLGERYYNPNKQLPLSFCQTILLTSIKNSRRIYVRRYTRWITDCAEYMRICFGYLTARRGYFHTCSHIDTQSKIPPSCRQSSSRKSNHLFNTEIRILFIRRFRSLYQLITIIPISCLLFRFTL